MRRRDEYIPRHGTSIRRKLSENPSAVERTALQLDDKVLCVGAGGKLAYCGEGEFVAISHVWQHGWQGHNEDGLCSRVLNMLLTSASHFGVEWVWIDAALISNLPELNSLAVNAMNRVYSTCVTTLACDRLLLAMDGGTDREKVLAMAVSDWMTRLWTMQEAMLSPKIVVLQRNGFWILDEMLETLLTGEVGKEDTHWEATGAILMLWNLAWNTEHPVDRVFVIGDTRKTTKTIDLTRALFPLFELQWPGSETTLQEAQIILLKHLGEDAYRLSWLHGPVGLPSPWTWAPLISVNCDGILLPIGIPISVEKAGLHGGWPAVAVEYVSIEEDSEDFSPTAQYRASITNTYVDPIRCRVKNDGHEFTATVFHIENDLEVWRDKRLLLLRAPMDHDDVREDLEYYNLVTIEGFSAQVNLMNRVGSVLTELPLRVWTDNEIKVEGVIS
jgi:hypothetical protein